MPTYFTVIAVVLVVFITQKIQRPRTCALCISAIILANESDEKYFHFIYISLLSSFASSKCRRSLVLQLARWRVCLFVFLCLNQLKTGCFVHNSSSILLQRNRKCCSHCPIQPHSNANEYCERHCLKQSIFDSPYGIRLSEAGGESVKESGQTVFPQVIHT